MRESSLTFLLYHLSKNVLSSPLQLPSSISSTLKCPPQIIRSSGVTSLAIISKHLAPSSSEIGLRNEFCKCEIKILVEKLARARPLARTSRTSTMSAMRSMADRRARWAEEGPDALLAFAACLARMRSRRLAPRLATAAADLSEDWTVLKAF
ncbi:hypothetical protein KCU91_g58, partial [Aureobasidium melanogenum]